VGVSNDQHHDDTYENEIGDSCGGRQMLFLTNHSMPRWACGHWGLTTVTQESCNDHLTLVKDKPHYVATMWQYFSIFAVVIILLKEVLLTGLLQTLENAQVM